MALRTRKPAKPIVETEEEDDDKKPAPKANRRKTVAGSAVLAGKVCFSQPFLAIVRPFYLRAPKSPGFLGLYGVAQHNAQNATLSCPCAKSKLIVKFRLRRGVRQLCQPTQNLRVNQAGV